MHCFHLKQEVAMRLQLPKKLLAMIFNFVMLLLLSACGVKYPDPGKISMDGQSTGTLDVNMKDTQQNPTMNLTNDEVRKAAEAGDPDAQYALGYMYYYGKGVPQNKALGESWINKSAAAGQPQAIEAQKILASLSRGNMAVSANPADSRQVPTDRNHLKAGLNEGSHNYASNNTNNIVSTASVTASAPAVAREDRGISDDSSSHTAVKTPASHLSKSRISLSELKNAPKNFYTVQLLGAYDQKDVARYIQNHRLQGKVATYRTIRNGRDWYVVVYGLYGSYKQADAAIKALPAVIQAQRPWINKVANVQASIDKPETVR